MYILTRPIKKFIIVRPNCRTKLMQYSNLKDQIDKLPPDRFCLVFTFCLRESDGPSDSNLIVSHVRSTEPSP